VYFFTTTLALVFIELFELNLIILNVLIHYFKAYDRMIAFITNENNMDTIRSELKSRKVESTNLWDTLFDLIILDAFEGCLVLLQNYYCDLADN